MTYVVSSQWQHDTKTQNRHIQHDAKTKKHIQYDVKTQCRHILTGQYRQTSGPSVAHLKIRSPQYPGMSGRRGQSEVCNKKN